MPWTWTDSNKRTAVGCKCRTQPRVPWLASIAVINYPDFLSKVVVQDPDILGEEPFKGTRVPVKSLFDHLKAGDSIDDFLDGPA